MSLLILSASDVETIISQFTPHELQTLMARVFSCLSTTSSSSYTPHRTLIPTPNHTALFMPARIAGSGIHGTTIKLVCVPSNPASDSRGLPASTLVLDETTGAVKAVVNARSLTPLRNAAGSLLSTNIVKLKSPTSIVAFGSGKQIEAHLDLHLRYFPSLKSCTIINRTLNSRVEALKQRMEPQFPLVSFRWIASHAQIDAPEHLRNIVASASLIICATSSTSPLFPSSWVRAGTHVILVGSYTPAMHEVDRELVQRAILQPGNHWQPRRQILLVDSRTACAAEAGELITAGVTGSQMVEMGEMVEFTDGGELVEFASEGGEEVVVEERDDVVVGTGPITMFKSVGVGLQDVAIACAVVDKAEELGIGTRVDGYDG